MKKKIILILICLVLFLVFNLRVYISYKKDVNRIYSIRKETVEEVLDDLSEYNIILNNNSSFTMNDYSEVSFIFDNGNLRFKLDNNGKIITGNGEGITLELDEGINDLKAYYNNLIFDLLKSISSDLYSNDAILSINEFINDDGFNNSFYIENYSYSYNDSIYNYHYKIYYCVNKYNEGDRYLYISIYGTY